MKSAVKLNRLVLLKFVLLCEVGIIQESSRKGNAKFNFLGITWGEQKVLKSALFRLSKSLKSKTFRTMVLPPVSSYSEIGTYAHLFSFSDLLALFYSLQPAST